jgi:acylphosphatase
MTASHLKRISGTVSGRVQGVGFRYFTRAKADGHGLSGWVRNMPGGGVEFEAQGLEDEIDAFLDELKEGPRLAHVAEIRVNEVPGEEEEKEFRIRY